MTEDERKGKICCIRKRHGRNEYRLKNDKHPDGVWVNEVYVRLTDAK